MVKALVMIAVASIRPMIIRRPRAGRRRTLRIAILTRMGFLTAMKTKARPKRAKMMPRARAKTGTGTPKSSSTRCYLTTYTGSPLISVGG